MGYRLDKRVRVFLDELDAYIVLRDPSQPFNPADKGSYSTPDWGP